MQNAYVSAQIFTTAVLEYRTKDLGLSYSRLAGMRLADKANIVWEYMLSMIGPIALIAASRSLDTFLC